MIQPKYNPKESLERIKLMMKYDSSKTLNENKSVIFEQVDIAKDALYINNNLKSTISDEGVIVNKLKNYKTADSFNKFLTQYKTNFGNDLGKDMFPTFLPNPDKKEIEDLNNHLKTIGMEFIITKNPSGQWNGWVFKGSTTTPSDSNVSGWEKFSCVPKLASKKGVKIDSMGGYLIGNFRYFANGRKANTKTKEITNYTCNDTEFKSKTTTKYKDCPDVFPIKQGCRNKTIKQVQACLGMPEKYQTGNFGPITQKYLKDAGLDVDKLITQETLETVCKKQPNTLNTQQPSDDKTQSGVAQNKPEAENIEVSSDIIDPNAY